MRRRIWGFINTKEGKRVKSKDKRKLKSKKFESKKEETACNKEGCPSPDFGLPSLKTFELSNFLTATLSTI
jgi:hypothetical protein